MKSIAIVLLTVALLLINRECRAEQFRSFHENVLGTSLELRIDASSSVAALQAEQAALLEIDRLTKIFSQYDPQSELSKFQTLPPGASMRVSSELYQTLRQCDQWTQLSDGAFNPAVEHLTRQWQSGAARGELPDDAEIAKAVALLNQQHWKFVDGEQLVIRETHLPISLNAIAKGVILDRVAASILTNTPGITGVMLNCGGDIRAVGQSTIQVEIAHPLDDALGAQPSSRLQIRNAAVATSGNSERYLEIAGVRYSHIFDPRNGRPVTEVASSTVVAPDGATADVVATICSVLPVADSLKLVDSLPNVACLLVSSGGQVVTSLNWPQAGNPAGGQAGKGVAIRNGEQPGAAKTLHQMLVQFKIGGEERTSRYRRPYVAAWVEDKDGFPVKTLSLFLMQNQPGPRWYRDLRRWYADDQLRRIADNTDLIATVSKPTRNPGEYKVSWDGRDDAGAALPHGDYTLLIEAAREHGTYQLIKHAFKLGGPAFDEQLKGNAEISAASVSYKFTNP